MNKIKRQLTIGEGIGFAIFLGAGLLATWISNVQAVTSIQTKQADDRMQIEQFRQDTRERLTRIEDKLDKLEEKR